MPCSLCFLFRRQSPHSLVVERSACRTLAPSAHRRSRHRGDRSKRGPVVGAAVGRKFSAAEPSWGVVAADVPELACAIAPEHRGRGVGVVLMEGFLARLVEAGERAVSLTVSTKNDLCLSGSYTDPQPVGGPPFRRGAGPFAPVPPPPVERYGRG